MVFILQNTQNRDNTAVQLKLDELLRAVAKARDSFIDIEELADDELETLADEMKEVREQHGVPGESPIGQAARAEREKRKRKAPAKQNGSSSRGGGGRAPRSSGGAASPRGTK
jgi:low affinity Fe/Cu permease